MDVCHSALRNQQYSDSSILHEFSADNLNPKSLLHLVPVVKETIKIKSQINEDADFKWKDSKNAIEIYHMREKSGNSSKVEVKEEVGDGEFKFLYRSHTKTIILSDSMKRVPSTAFNKRKTGKSSGKVCIPNNKVKFYAISSDSVDPITVESVESQNPRENRKRHKKYSSPNSKRHSENNQETKYRRQRDRNNEASRKSRLKRKLNLQNIYRQVAELEQHNNLLKSKASKIERINKRLRELILQLCSSQNKNDI